MLRVILVLGSLALILGGLVVQHSAMIPRRVAAPELPVHVDQGIPLARIELHSVAQPLTEEEFATGRSWWNDQRQGLLDQVTDLLRNESRADGWTSLYASATTDGQHVLVVVGNQGRLGTIRLAGDGTLLACDSTPDEVLPIILPSVEGGFRRPTAAAVRGIETRLRYLREGSPVAWHAPALLEAIPVVELVEVDPTLLVFGCASAEPEAFGVAPVRITDRLVEIPIEAEATPPQPSANN